MVIYLHQRFPAIFTNSFEPTSSNYDAEHFLFTKIISSSICICFDIFTIEARTLSCVFGPQVGKLLFFFNTGFLLMFRLRTMAWLISGCTDCIFNHKCLIYYTNLSTAMNLFIPKVHIRRLLSTFLFIAWW